MLLIWLLLIPFVAGGLCYALEMRRGGGPPRWIALIASSLILLSAFLLWATGDYSLANAVQGTAQWQIQFRLPWIPSLGIFFHLALDGLSVIMLLLTGVMSVLAVASSWNQPRNRDGLFYANLMWLVGGVIGIFLAVDLFAFFFFWEMMLIPMALLVALWGHDGARATVKRAAATKFFIYTQASGLLMLAAIIGLVFVHYQQTGSITFDYNALLQTSPTGGIGMVLMLGFFIAFATKLTTVPFHGWLPDFHTYSPTDSSVDLTGVLVKTGAYGLLRFAVPLFPHASATFAPAAMILGLIGIYYGAIVAFAQSDMKRFIGYTSIAHMGFVLIGIYAGTLLSIQGAILQLVASALSTAGLFLVSSQVYTRLGTRDMRSLGGLFGLMGALPGFALAFSVAALGMPATANFIGEFLVLFGAFAYSPIVVVFATIGLVLAAVYALYLIHRVYWGQPSIKTPTDGLAGREYASLLLILTLTLIIGLYPNSVLHVTTGAAQEIAHWFDGPIAAAPHS
ncbi:NADH-quinone oxidoreductase subunit M [Salinisphaera sp. USBA-960]|uniref:NADH-quinone oxidoreductase subunit M n=1 Tax=Salinisphaera orenii TaxID=856731 RepID=UPI000DBE5968|nr:NADH-quinone oxidoreductase subunit M [Salifodinibacter halophilus]NNC26297.1 NADH-quinone oxidoreductase subunit M [Salifodinibacter halophilus]